MKTKLFLLFFIVVPGMLLAQKENENTFTAKIDGEVMQTEPRQVKFGRAVYFTANTTSPETMLRIWLGDFKGKASFETGTYLVVSADEAPSKKEIKEGDYVNKYKGFAFIRYVTETRAPRMNYHVGDSQNNEELVVVNNTGDGTVEITFDNMVLAGTYWKEKDAATVFGGGGRLKGKMESKMLSQLTGYDWNIDPEGNGYRKLKETDTINLTEGKMVIKLKD